MTNQLGKNEYGSVRTLRVLGTSAYSVPILLHIWSTHASKGLTSIATVKAFLEVLMIGFLKNANTNFLMCEINVRLN